MVNHMKSLSDPMKNIQVFYSETQQKGDLMGFNGVHYHHEITINSPFSIGFSPSQRLQAPKKKGPGRGHRSTPIPDLPLGRDEIRHLQISDLMRFDGI